MRWIGPGTYLVVLGHFLVRMSSDVDWKDSGELIAAAHSLGVPHGSGYPLFVLAGKLMEWIPLGGVALRLNFLNVILGAMTIAWIPSMVHGWSRDERSRPFHGSTLFLAAGIAVWLATRRTFVVEAGTAENTMLFYALVLFSLGLFLRRPGIRSRLMAIFLMGLAGSYHPLAIPCLAVMMVGSVPKPFRLKSLAGITAAALVGILAATLFVPLRASQSPPVNFGARSSMAAWWNGWADYARINQAVWPGWDIHRWVLTITDYLAEFFPAGAVWVLLPLAVLGFRELVIWRGWWAGLLIAGIISGSALGVIVNVGQERLGQSLLLPILIAVVAGGGFVWTVERMGKKSRWVGGLAATLLLTLVVGGLLLSPVRLHATGHPRQYVERMLMECPPHSILVVPGSQAHFVLWEMQVAENWRPDVTVISESLLPFEWYLGTKGDSRGILTTYLSSNVPMGRPVLVSSVARVSKLARRGYWPMFRRELEEYAFIPRGMTFQVAEREPRSPTGEAGVTKLIKLATSPIAPETVRLLQEAYFNLAVYYRREGLPEGEEFHLRRAAEVDPSDQLARFPLEWFLKKRGRKGWGEE